jgi:carbon-monoxide dehydrogenase large subunit
LPLIPGYDQATARLLVDGSLEVRAGVHSHGQGMETTLAQIAHEVTGIDIANIHVILGDTGTTPFSTGTYASRSIVMTGSAVAKSCEALVPRLLAIGAHLMQCATSTVHYMPGARRRVTIVGVGEGNRRSLVPTTTPAAARR